jgi:hypothetical protein
MIILTFITGASFVHLSNNQALGLYSSNVACKSVTAIRVTP